MSEPIPASVIVMTRNEERNLAKCLESVREFDEVFVVDSASEDRTREIAAEHGATVVEFAWNGRYPKKKQWCLEHLPFRHDWVLYVDADEEATPELVAELRRVFERGPTHAAYFARFAYTFLGRTLRHGQPVFKLVLFDRTRGRFLDLGDTGVETAGEVEPHFQPRIEGSSGVLRAPLLHHDMSSLYAWFQRHNGYSDWEAFLKASGKLVNRDEAQPGLRRHLKRIFNALPGRPLAFFLLCYVVRGGFLDGRAGFHYALAKSFYYWQVDVKTVELELRRR